MLTPRWTLHTDSQRGPSALSDGVDKKAAHESGTSWSLHDRCPLHQILDRLMMYVVVGLSLAPASHVLCRKQRECARPLSSDRMHGGVTWVGLLVFLCEVRQALSCESVGIAGVHRLLAAPSEDHLAAALSFDTDYRPMPTSTRHCHVVPLFLVALSSVALKLGHMNNELNAEVGSGS